jgi:hypothetical protein
MTVNVEVENQLQSALLVEALQEKREEQESRYGTDGVEAVERLLEQMEGTVAHDVLEEVEQ